MLFAVLPDATANFFSVSRVRKRLNEARIAALIVVNNWTIRSSHNTTRSTHRNAGNTVCEKSCNFNSSRFDLSQPRNNCFSFNFNASARQIAFNKARWCLLHFFHRARSLSRKIYGGFRSRIFSSYLFVLAAKVQQVECCDFSARPLGVENHIFATRNMQIAFEMRWQIACWFVCLHSERTFRVPS